MDLLRVGDKLISRQRIEAVVDRVLERRVAGLSQQEVAAELGIDRTFISRLESLGEVRKGGRIALIGFPVGNKAELEEMARRAGIDFMLLMSDQERWDFARGLSGADLFNRIMDILSQVREYDSVIFLGSDMRIRMLEQILGVDRVIGVQIGASPIKADVYVDPGRVRALIESLKA